jgi:hypothetical protein
VQVHLNINDGNSHKTLIYQGRKMIMNTLGLLETLLVADMITIEEYKERKAVYVEALLELYSIGILTHEELKEKLNK